MTTQWAPEPELLQHLDEAVTMILTTQKENGQFGSEPWISTDQNVLWPLTVAWSQSGSRHFHDEPVLDAIVRGGLALQEAQDENGMWMFRKKDYSEWGPIRMPWAYSRWIRAFAVIKDQMLYVQAGCGVVADSDPENEYQETVNKALALVRAAEEAEAFASNNS